MRPAEFLQIHSENGGIGIALFGSHPLVGVLMLSALYHVMKSSRGK